MLENTYIIRHLTSRSFIRYNYSIKNFNRYDFDYITVQFFINRIIVYTYGKFERKIGEKDIFRNCSPYWGKKV